MAKAKDKNNRKGLSRGGPNMEVIPHVDLTRQDGEEAVPGPASTELKRLSKRDQEKAKLLEQMEEDGPAREYDAPPRKRLPMAGLPKQEAGAEGQPEEEYIGAIREYYKTLFFEGKNLNKVLEERGLRPITQWVSETRKLLIEDDTMKTCLEYTLESFSKSKDFSKEKIEEAYYEDRLGGIPEIKLETTKTILTYYAHALETILERIKKKANRGKIEAELQNVNTALGEYSEDKTDQLEKL